MDYSLNNHYRWGWNDEWFNEAQQDQAFRVTVGRVSRKVLSFREECRRAVSNLANQFTKPIRVGLSGGSDSQAVCLSLLDQKIPFTPVVLILKGPRGGVRNEHDVKQAFAFCKKMGISEPVVEELGLQAFYDEQAIRLSKEHCLTNARVVVQLYLVEKYKNDFAFIMAGGDLVLSKGSELEGNPIVTSFAPTPIQQHLVKYGIEGCTKFFMYSPELMAAYLSHPAVRAFRVAHEAIYQSFNSLNPKVGSWACFNYFCKPAMYVEQFPEIVQAMKFTGFEHANDLVSEAQALMNYTTRVFKPNNRKIIMTIDDLEAHLTNEGPEQVWYSSAD